MDVLEKIVLINADESKDTVGLKMETTPMVYEVLIGVK